MRNKRDRSRGTKLSFRPSKIIHIHKQVFGNSTPKGHAQELDAKSKARHIKSAKILEDCLLTVGCIMKSGQPLVMPMHCFVCRLFAALSVSLALSFRDYAVETLRVLACRSIKHGAKNQRFAESWINYTMESGVSAGWPGAKVEQISLKPFPQQTVRASLSCLCRCKMPSAVRF